MSIVYCVPPDALEIPSGRKTLRDWGAAPLV